MTDTPLHFLGIAGSLRSASYSAALLSEIIAIGAAHARITTFPLHDVPLYNQDLEHVHGQGPEPVLALRKAIAAADGLIIVSPEYNYGISGVLKNALDWASRPAMASVLAGKPVLIVTNSPGALGGVRAQEQLRQTLIGTLSRVVVRPEIVVSSVATKLSGGKLTDGQTRTFIKDGLSDLAAEVARLRSSTAR
jgi:chromate reductase, NAD(P)H dehydrogenase (quinone)